MFSTTCRTSPNFPPMTPARIATPWSATSQSFAFWMSISASLRASSSMALMVAVSSSLICLSAAANCLSSLLMTRRECSELSRSSSSVDRVFVSSHFLRSASSLFRVSTEIANSASASVWRCFPPVATSGSVAPAGRVGVRAMICLMRTP